jgi:hypothetical protein
MVKLLICLTAGLALAVVMLELRQQRLELAYQCTRLHNQIGIVSKYHIGKDRAFHEAEFTSLLVKNRNASDI